LPDRAGALELRAPTPELRAGSLGDALSPDGVTWIREGEFLATRA
jgi:hypothetical protein